MIYSEMTDFEINKAVAIAEGHYCYYGDGSFTNGLMGRKVTVKGNGVVGCMDFCSSWTDAGPIIEKHMICLSADVFAEPQDGGKWVAQPAYGWDSERVRSDNPLRAAMIVFLMMQEKPDAA